MSSPSKLISVPAFCVIESGILPHLAQILEKEGITPFHRPLILSDEPVLAAGGSVILNQFKQHHLFLVPNNLLSEAERAAEDAIQNGCDVVISVGGGKVLDVGKYAAQKADLPHIACPTTPSNDGLASSNATLIGRDGVSASHACGMAKGIAVDLDLIAKAPLRNVQAGVADLISNLSAYDDWKLAAEMKDERMDGFAASLALVPAELILERCKTGADLVDASFLAQLVNGLILSGIAMHFAGSSRPASGAEHKISHAIDALYPGTAMHGEQVAVGMVYADMLRESPRTTLLQTLFPKFGIPTQPSDLGLSEEMWSHILAYAPKIHPDRYTILEHVANKSNNNR